MPIGAPRRQIDACAAEGCGPALERILHSCEAIAAPAARWLDNPADIDEAVQRTRIQVHRHIQQKGSGSLRAWIRQISVNEARSVNRKRFGTSRPLSGLPADDTLDDRQLLRISTAVANGDLWRWSVAQLPEDQAEAYLLREVSKLPYEEIASQVGIPVNTAKTRVRRARMRLVELIADRDPDLGGER